MLTYRTAWLVVTSLLTCLGVTSAALTLPPQQIAGFAADGVLVAVIIGTALRAYRPRPTTVLRTAVQLTAAAGLGVPVGIAIAGLATAIGPSALLVPALLAAANPRAIELLTCRRAQRAAPPPRCTGELPTPRADLSGTSTMSPRGTAAAHTVDIVDTFTAEQLCRLWQTSYLEITNAHSAAELLRLSDTRRAILDTLAANNPSGFARWIATSPRAAGDLRRYLCPPAP